VRVVLKEARPHAGLAADGADAVERLRREREMLERLAGVEGVPAVHDHFALGEHHFLALEFIEGTPLNKVFAQRWPMNDAAAGPAEFAAYTEWALGMCAQVEKIITAIHGCGVIHGDLHLFNVLLSSLRRCGRSPEPAEPAGLMVLHLDGAFERCRRYPMG
jgi:RIO-like serine/threonine protein kinase